MPRRGKHGDGVYEDPPDSGIFWARWKDEGGHDRCKKIGHGERARKQAQKYVYNMREIVLDKKIDPEKYQEKPPDPECWTLQAAIDDYQANSRASTKSKSRSTDGYHGKALKKLWGDRIVDDIKPSEVKDWMTRRSRTRKPGTVNREFGFLKRVCRRAIEHEHAKIDPTGGVRKLKDPGRPPRYLRPEEDARLQEQLTGREWLTVELAYRTGLRAGEQFPLAKTQVNLHAHVITLHDPKSGQAEVVQLNSRAVAILRELMADNDSPWVFPASRGSNHLEAGNFIEDVFKPALERAKIPNFRWHDLRHTFASWLAIAGVDLYRIQTLTRHRSYRMVQAYAHLLPSHVRDAVEQIAGPPPVGPSPVVQPPTKPKNRMGVGKGVKKVRGPVD